MVLMGSYQVLSVAIAENKNGNRQATKSERFVAGVSIKNGTATEAREQENPYGI